MNMVDNNFDPSYVRVAIVEDHLANILHLDKEDDQAVLKALVLLVFRRLENFIRDNTQEIEIFTPSQGDGFLRQKCMTPLPSRANLERASSLMKHLDQLPTEYGSASIDEVFLAVIKIANYFSARLRW